MPTEKTLPLPVFFDEDHDMDLIMRKSLQWSSDGQKVLVYASEKTPGHCPKKKDLVMNRGYYDRSCWLVFDSVQGKMLWYPGDDIVKATGIPSEYLGFDYDAVLSPDGEKIVTTYTDARIGGYFKFVISTINSKTSATIALEQGLFIHWAQ